MADLLKTMPYYWVTAQSEYSTDILFKSAAHLSELYPRLLSHSTLCFGAKEVMSFLGRKIRPNFEGEIVSDICDLSFKRIPGARIKHRVKQNWLKMYDKAGSILRLEMVINDPEGFTVRRQVIRKGKKVMRWVDMRKGVAYLFRYRDVSLAANSRYLAALAEVDNPTDAIRTLDRITTRKQLAPRRSAKAFNPLARDEAQIFRALLDGQHMIRGFSNPDIRQKLKRFIRCGRWRARNHRLHSSKRRLGRTVSLYARWRKLEPVNCRNRAKADALRPSGEKERVQVRRARHGGSFPGNP